MLVTRTVTWLSIMIHPIGKISESAEAKTVSYDVLRRVLKRSLLTHELARSLLIIRMIIIRRFQSFPTSTPHQVRLNASYQSLERGLTRC